MMLFLAGLVIGAMIGWRVTAWVSGGGVIRILNAIEAVERGSDI